MRALFGCLAVLLGAVSISLAARYGYKGADTEHDGSISAVVFGLIALCARSSFDAAAVRSGFLRPSYWCGATSGLFRRQPLVVTFTNSLGAIAGRAAVPRQRTERAATKAKSAPSGLAASREATLPSGIHAHMTKP
jgi:hypothetical protein